MGGGGSYYDRDTSDGYATADNYSRYSRAADKAMSRRASQRRIDSGLRPKNRRIASMAKNPVVFGFDVTGSMGRLPKIIFDKAPLLAGQIIQNRYLEDPDVSLAAIGDVSSDRAPIQICDFSSVRGLDDSLTRIWLERGGGNNGSESYEFLAYYYARFCQFRDDAMPFFLITGDAHMEEALTAKELKAAFGGTHQTISSKEVFDELRAKFKGNVFYIHRTRSIGGEDAILAQWQRMLGKDHILILRDDKAIADLVLGLFAIMTGARTLDEYCRDMVTKREKAQTKERIADVRRSLEPLSAIAPTKRAEIGKGSESTGTTKGKGKTTTNGGASAKKEGSGTKGSKGYRL